MPDATPEALGRAGHRMRRSSAGIIGVSAQTRREAWQRRGCLRTWQVAATIFILSLLAGTADRAVEEKQGTDKQGVFLVARRELADPFFEKSVVLMLPIKETSLLVGLIINRPTKVPLRDLFSESKAIQKLDQTAYFGGPVDVEIGARSAIFRSKSPPKNAVAVFGDVYACFDPDTIATLLEDSQQETTVRVFLGRSQWAPIQLEVEIAKGAWYSVHESADPIFGKFPEGVWRTLIDQADPRPLVKYDSPILPLGDFRFLARHSLVTELAE
jgi:putative transcriptional regulator